jgi:hypothetical protein
VRQYFTSAERSEALARAAPPRQDLPRVDYSPAPMSFKDWVAFEGLTNRQAAERLGVSTATIGNWKRAGAPQRIMDRLKTDGH